jgi:hypothetical protein
MACELDLADVTYDCTDLGIGGLKSVYIANRSKLIANSDTANAAWVPISVSGDAVTVTQDATIATGADDSILGTIGADMSAQINFNLKDGFSVFTDVKTVTADGIVSSVPTVAVEVPSMSLAHRNALNALASGGSELVAFVETAAGTYHMLGFDYGMYAATIDGTSGSGRGEKNRFQVTLTGDEDSLAYSLTADQWADITSSVAA